jgi:hypothetical protein
MQAQTIATVLAFLTVLLGATWTYWLTKKKDREAEIRREKLEYYKAFIASISGVLKDESTPEGHRAFAKACNNLFLFAPQSVLDALREYQNLTRKGSSFSREEYEQVYSALLFEIRRDLEIQPKDKRETFRAWVWASGVKLESSSKGDVLVS